MRITLRSSDGHYVRAENGGGARLLAQAGAPGAWETFSVSGTDGRDDDILSGQTVRLQASTGQYAAAGVGGDGAVRADRWQAEPSVAFTLDRLEGAGALSHGDHVSLRSPDGHYVSAEAGGGRELVATRTAAGPWEQFTVERWPVTLVRLRAADGHFVVADAGSGGLVRASGSGPELKGIFALVNRSGRRDRLDDGDRVSLKAMSGTFLGADGGGGGAVHTGPNTAGSSETFRIAKVGVGGPIGHADHVTLQAAGGQFITAEGGGGRELVANRLGAGAWETFALELAQEAPASFADAPLSGPGQPFHATPPGSTTPRRVQILMVQYAGLTGPLDETLTLADLRDIVFGSGLSVKTWAEHNSNNEQSIADAGVFGPLRLPRTLADYQALGDGLPNATWGDALEVLRRQGVTVPTADVHMMFDVSGSGGHTTTRAVNVWSNGVNHVGAWVGTSLFAQGGPVQGRAQINLHTLFHEMAHAMYGLLDRYNVCGPVAGDVIANRHEPHEWETFVLRLVDPGTTISHGAQVTLRAHVSIGEGFVTPEGGGGGVVNADSAAAGSNFRLERARGAGALHHGDAITLKTPAGFFLTAEAGGGRELRADRRRAGAWETFTLNGTAGSGGAIVSGSEVTLVTDSQHLVTARAHRSERPGTFEGPAGRYTMFSDGTGTGVGGAYDIIDVQHICLLTAYDRIRDGHLRPRLLTPDSGGAYALRPAIAGAEAYVLWDPLYPRECYLAENRLQHASFEQIPDSGLAITWIDETRNRQLFPALISALAPNLPANPEYNLTLDALGRFRRNEAGALFRNGQVVLHRGEGGPSRFRLAVHALPDGRVSLSIL